MQRIEEIVIKAYQFPYCIFTILGISGLVLLILYITASDSEKSAFSGIASLCLFPSLMTFIIAAILSIMVGIKCVKKAYSDTNHAMQKQIEKEYSNELEGLKGINSMFDECKMTELLDYP